jgi:hypothetical protein
MRRARGAACSLSTRFACAGHENEHGYTGGLDAILLTTVAAWHLSPDVLANTGRQPPRPWCARAVSSMHGPWALRRTASTPAPKHKPHGPQGTSSLPQ